MLLLLILLLGVGGSYKMSELFRADARADWEAQAAQTGQWLSGALLSWLEESYAPLSGIAILFESPLSVTEDDYLDAVDSLESRATALFIDATAVFRPVEGAAGALWQVRFTTDFSGTLVPGAAHSKVLEIAEGVEVAASHPGQTLLGRPFTTGEGERYSTVALAISATEGDLIIVGLLNYGALVDGLFEIHKPRGIALSIEGRFTTPDGPGSSTKVLGDHPPDTLYSSTTRTVSAGADLSLTWH
jgi:two-component system sensor histidine kinase/response regulator